jgi:biotin carboxyl carrier protein
MKLRTSITDYETEIVISDEGSHVVAEIDDRHYELEVHESSANSYLLLAEHRVFNCRVEGRPESRKSLDVIVGTTRYAVTLIDPKRLRGTATASGQADEAARIVAPMPGRIVRILVELGSHVEIGAGLIVVEAMKMQNEMKSPKSGTIVALNVQAGATVNGGDVLVIVE